MKNSTMKKRDTASNRSKTKMTRMKNGIKIIVTSVLLLTTSSATAGIIFIPTGGQYQASELAQVNIQNLGDENFRVHSRGLGGELKIQGSDFPPEYDVPTTAKGILPFDQELELVIDVAGGTVSGRSATNFTDASSAYITATAEVLGTATCLPLNGRECGQLVVDLELQGVLSDPNDPSKVGQVNMVMLGSLVWDDTNVAHWAAMSANATISGNEGLINSLSWSEGDWNHDGIQSR